jgi:multidrug efflux system membrane fusion protein
MTPENGPGMFGYRAPPPRKSWTRNIIWIAVAIVLMLLAAWALVLLKNHNAEQPSPEAAAFGRGAGGGRGGGGGGGRGGGGGFGGGAGGFGGGATTVAVANAQIGSIPITVDALGTVTPMNNVTVVPRVTGELVKVDIHEGQVVKKGQRLALIDPRPYQAALDQAKGQLAHDEALLADARIDLQRYETLLSQNSIASQQVDTQKYLVKQDEGAVTSDKANVASAELNLKFCSIISPVNGIVGLRKVDPGNLVQAGQSTGLFVITTLDPMDVVFALPEDDLPQLQSRLHAGAKLPVTAFDRAFVNQLGVGTFFSIDSEVDTTTGTIHAKARFENKANTLFPEQFVNVRVLLDTLSNAVTIPTSAVRHGAPGDFVYTIAADPKTKGHIANVTVVKLGPQSGETIAILSGLNVGQQVVTEGGDRLRDGAPVMLPGDKPRFGGGAGGGSGRKGRGQWSQGGGQGPPSGGAQASDQGGQAPPPGQGGDQTAPAAGGQHHWNGGQGGQGGQGGWPHGGGSSRGPWNGQHRRQGQQDGGSSGDSQ